MSVKLLRHDNSADFDRDIIISLDNVPYKAKPTGGEIGAITNRLQTGTSSHRRINIKELAKAIESGCTLQGPLLRDKQNDNEDTDSRFSAQQLFYIDIDNDYKDKESGKKYKSPAALDTPEQILDKARGAGLQPCIIAESFSSGKKDPNGEPIPKYHVCFASSEPVKDVNESRRIIKNLMNVYDGQADISCKNPSRLLFGTTKDKQVLYCPAANTPEKLLNCSAADREAPAAPTPAEPAPRAKASTEPSPTPAGQWNEQYKNFEAEPDILLQMIDTNSLSYEEFCSITASHKAAGGSDDIWKAWANNYHSDKHSHSEVIKANEKTRKGMNGKRHTIGTLKKLCQQYAPDTYNAYMQQLAEQTKAERKRRGTQSRKQLPNNSAEPERVNSAESGSQITGDLIPLELPFKRPANYIDFAFKDSKNKIIIIPQLLAENVRKTCKYIFVKGADPAEAVRRFWYEHGVYKPIADEFIKNVLRSRIQPFGISLCKKSYIEEAFYQLSIDNAFHADTELNADENIINFQNGLLHLDTMEITPHTPEFLSTIQIPCKYNPQLTLENAPIFDRFITHLANNDKDSKQTLLEYIGAAISNVDGAHFKKALFLKGAGNCGKSQYINLLRELLSERYFGSQSLEKLESRFGKYALYNKRVVGDPDIRFMKMAELAAFKQITGGDPIDLESKGKNSFTYKYKGLLLFGCNQAPLFGGDRGQWVYDRMLFINCGDPIPEPEQDPLLIQKMRNEFEAIAAVAISALKTAIKNRYKFTESAESKKTLTAYKVENDIVQEFIIDCCVVRNRYNDNITQQVLFDTFLAWARNCNYKSLPTLKEFKRSLAEFIGVADVKELNKKSNGKWYYIYTLTDEMKKEFGLYDSIKNTDNNRDIY